MTKTQSVSIMVGVMMLCCVPTAWAQQAAAQQIVNQYWPSSVERDKEGNPDDHSCLAVMKKSPNGEPSRIAAGYAGGGVLRVLQREKPGQFRVAFEAVVDYEAIFCEIQLLDIDKDGADDILIDFAGQADTIWVFRAVGTTFQNITPVDSHGLTDLINASPMDLDHQGPLELVTTALTTTTEGDRQFWYEIYRYRRARLRLDSEAVLVQPVWPTPDGKAKFLENRTFDLINHKPGMRYVLRIVNGDRTGRKRARGVTISINDERLMAAAKLTASIEFLDLPLRGPLKAAENEIHVVVNGPADAEITIVIQAAK